MRIKNWIICAAVAMGFACGDDSEVVEAACPKDSVVGMELACSCGDAGMAGIQVCTAEMTLSDCDCAVGSTDGTGGDGSGTTGSTGGTGGSPVGAGGTGGTPTPSSDAGMMPADGGATPAVDAGGTPVGTLPTDGNQLAVCADGRDCNKGLDCYQAGGGVDFCTAACTDDTGCMALDGADWTCSPDDLCEVACDGQDDNMSCPDGLVCTRVGGGGITPTTFRCKGSEAAVPPTPAFASCMSNMACGMGRICIGAGMGRTGYCSTSCMEDDDCTALTTTSGNLTASCEFGGFAMGLTSNCALNCDRDADKCPDGMMCKMGVGAAPNLCGY